MSDIPQPKSSKEEPQPAEVKDDSLVVNPINIARARHASAHGQSVVVDKAKQTATRKMQALPTNNPASTRSANQLSETFFGSSSCLFITLLGLAFLVGGVIGGLVGGGLLLSVSGDSLALWDETPTPTALPSPTPAPVETLTPTPSPQPSATPATEDVIARIIPSVVTIVNQQNSLGLSFNPEEGRVVGSGVILDTRGYIATNHHVVENAREIRVLLADGRDLVGELVVSDPTEDLAVIKIYADNLSPIRWGDSSTVRPGQMVYAIGSPLGDFPSSVSFGIVSGLNRALEMDEHVIDGLIQTDAAINRGSSGGPLINLQGEMIGINTFIIRESEDRGVAEGIAFALPTEAAKDILFPWIAAHSGENVPIPAGESN